MTTTATTAPLTVKPCLSPCRACGSSDRYRDGRCRACSARYNREARERQKGQAPPSERVCRVVRPPGTLCVCGEPLDSCSTAQPTDYYCCGLCREMSPEFERLAMEGVDVRRVRDQVRAGAGA